MYMPQGGYSKMSAWVLVGILFLVAACSVVYSLAEEQVQLPQPSGSAFMVTPETVPPTPAVNFQATEQALRVQVTQAAIQQAASAQEHSMKREQVLMQGILVLSAAAALSITFFVAALAVHSTQFARARVEQAAAVRLQEERKLVEDRIRMIEVRAALLAAQQQFQQEKSTVRAERSHRTRAPIRKRAQRALANEGDYTGWPPEAEEELNITNLPMAG